MLFRRTLLYLPAQILAPTLQFVLVLAWAHLLPSALVGTIALATAIQEIAFAFFYTWWSQYLLRHLAGFRLAGGMARFLQAEAAAILGSSAAMLACATPVAALYFADHIDRTTLALMAAFLLTRSLATYLAERARADSQIGLYTIVQVGIPAGALALTVPAVDHWGPTAGAAFGPLIACQGAAIIACLLRMDMLRAGLRVHLDIGWQAARFGGPVMAGALLSALTLNAPRFIVDGLYGLEVAGAFAVPYGMGLRIASVAVMLVTAGAYPLAVSIYERDGADAAYRQLASNFRMVLLVVLPVGIGAISVSPALIEVLIPPGMRDTAHLALPLAVAFGTLRYLRSHTVDQVFLLNRRTRAVTAVTLLELALGSVLGLAGAADLGAPGAVLGPVAASAAALIVSWVLASRIRAFTSSAKDAAAILAAAAPIPLIVLANPATGGLGSLVLATAVGAITYGAGILVLSRMNVLCFR
ncbi:lipopolysaccharide biosynthesis protein [Chthonobacter rhizosphaerae]|uniref:lipopolysaccharide biosynthesis protein n=1 Tax=Chthonobacter rhizosphaerae TaxID=2735553 RepID=UPI0015EE8890|nr:hypothetical protein [Chthonobacter rhizosphaerae]